MPPPVSCIIAKARINVNLNNCKVIKLEKKVEQSFAERLKNARAEVGISQQKMSDLLEIPKRTIEEWESKRRNPPKWAERLVIEEVKRIPEKHMFD